MVFVIRYWGEAEPKNIDALVSEAPSIFFGLKPQFVNATYKNKLPKNWINVSNDDRIYKQISETDNINYICRDQGFEPPSGMYDDYWKRVDAGKKILQHMSSYEYKRKGVKLTLSPLCDPLEIVLDNSNKLSSTPKTVDHEEHYGLFGTSGLTVVLPKHDVNMIGLHEELKPKLFDLMGYLQESYGIIFDARLDVGDRSMEEIKLKPSASIPAFAPGVKRRMTMITSVNSKGGVGKTDILTTLGLYLANYEPHGYRVLAIDCDAQATQYATLCGKTDLNLLGPDEKNLWYENFIGPDGFKSPMIFENANAGESTLRKGIETAVKKMYQKPMWDDEAFFGKEEQTARQINDEINGKMDRMTELKKVRMKKLGKVERNLKASLYPVEMFYPDGYYRKGYADAYTRAIGDFSDNTDFLLLDLPPVRRSSFDITPISSAAQFVDSIYMLLVSRPIDAEINNTYKNFLQYRKILASSGMDAKKICPVMVLNFSDGKNFQGEFKGTMKMFKFPKVIRHSSETEKYSVGMDSGFHVKENVSQIELILSDAVGHSRSDYMKEKVANSEIKNIYSIYSKEMMNLCNFVSRNK